MSNIAIDFPSQIIADSKKGKSFYEECADSAIKLMNHESYNGVRFSRAEKTILYKLGVDEVDPRDMAKTFNPNGLPDLEESFRDIRNYPIEQPIFSLLKGEAIQRPFNYTIKLLNPEAVSEINQKKLDLLMEFANKHVLDQNYDEQQAKVKLDNLIDELHDYRDMRSISATKLLEKIKRDNDLEVEFNKVWDSHMYVGERIMSFDIVNGQMVIKKANDLNIYRISSGISNNIEDSSIIIYEDYQSLSQIMFNYREYLTKSDIKILEGEIDKEQRDIYPEYFPAAPTVDGQGYLIDEAVFDESDYGLGSVRNNAGDIRVLRIFWRGKRKLKVVKSIDGVGNVQLTMHDEKYQVNEELGEVLEDTIWIDRWEEATKIEEDILIKTQPWVGNSYSKVDFSLRTHPFVGDISTLNDVSPISLMSKIKNLKYLYNVLRRSEEMAIGKNLGNVIEIDIATLPNKEGWDFDRVLYYMKAAGVKIVDSTNQTEEGKYVGNNTTGRSLNLSQFDHVAELNNILEQLKAEIMELSGVSPNRLGQTSSRETKGGIERSVLQSSNTTEPYFKEDDDFKRKVFTNALELSKIWIKDARVDISDWTNGTIEMLNTIDPEDFSYWDYGIYVSDSAQDLSLKGSIDEMAGMLLQSEVITYSNYLDIKANSDPNYSRVIIKRAEKKKAEQAQQQSEEARKEAEAQRQFLLEQEELKFQREIQMKQLEAQIAEQDRRLQNENNLEIELLKQEKLDLARVLEENKLKLDELKAANENANKQTELQIKDKEADAKIKQANKQSNNK